MLKSMVAAAVLALAALSAGAQAPGVAESVTKRCAMCHGDKGESMAEDFPRLAGQHESYLAKQLQDFRAGRRQGPMVRMAKGLSDGDIAALAKYYAAQPAPPSAARTDLFDVGRYVHLHGNPYSRIPACKVCHGEGAHGTEALPRLAGQNAAYLERQIREFTQRSRSNDNEVMHVIAERLTPLEVRAVAEYLASLP